MATVVYQSADNVIVSQTGTPTLTILKDRSKYIILQPTLSLDGITNQPAEYIQFLDTFTNDIRTDLMSNVQSDTGATFETLADLQKYLSFIPRANVAFITEQGATAENQTTVIAQNEEIQKALDTNILNTDNLDIIKAQQKANNKILTKIYNPE
jgi:hypothetical protein